PAPGAPKSAPAIDLGRLPSMPEVKSQLDRIKTKTVAASRPAVRYLSREVNIRGHFVPLWLPVGIVAATALGALLVVSLSGDAAGPPAGPVTRSSLPESTADEAAEAPKSAPSKTLDAHLMGVIEAAQVGSDTALYALEYRSDGDRSD